ncbi:MAG: LysR family transcriptional regulator [Pseudomonadota bacterium]
MSSLDVRWLEVFCEIYKTRSVSRSAEILNLSQPAVSIALSRLRQHFNDPLFVRTSRGMEPTAMGHDLLTPISEALDALARATGQRPAFDPLTSNRTFNICMSDISQIVLLPNLWRHLRTVAPSIRIDVAPLSDDTAPLLESGNADLALGFVPQLEKYFHEMTLFRQSYVCAVSADHPRVREGLTLEQFETEDHAEVTRSGTGHLIINRELLRQGITRRVVLKIPNFLSAGVLAERTSLLILIPEYLADFFKSQSRIETFPLPFELQDYAVKLYWHERYHRDEGIVWIREVIRNLMRFDAGSSPGLDRHPLQVAREVRAG